MPTGMQRQALFARAAIVKDLAFQAQRAENAAMGTALHKPRPFIRMATAITRANEARQGRYLMSHGICGVYVAPGKTLLGPVNVPPGYGQVFKGLIARLAADP